MFEKRFNTVKCKRLTIFLISCLITSSFIIYVGSVPQPPIDTTVYNVATIGQPARMDPARAYDTASGELLQNIYQTLIWWSDKKPITFTPGVGYNLTLADYADLEQYAPVLCTEVPTIANGRIVVNASGSFWRFTINTNAQFQPWIDHLGTTQPPRNITAEDVVYSFQRQMIYDSPYSPGWMYATPAFGIPGFWATYDMDATNSFNVTNGDEAIIANKIQNWCYAVGNDVYFNFTLPWAEGPLRQIFAQTWGGIVHPDWVKEMGGWDGSWATGWSQYYHWKPTLSRSELDTYKSPATYPGHGSKYASFTQVGARGAIGTGPYKFTSWDTVSKTWRIDYNPDYWAGWTQAGDKAGNYLHTIIEKGADSWPTRKMLFLEGEFDACAVPKANMYDLLTSTYNPIAGINLVYNIAALQNNVMLFTFSEPYESPYQSYVGYPTHKTSAQPYFFNNTHIRRAFAWALNYTAYIQQAWFGEAIVQRTWWVDGLSPASYKNTNASMPQRNLNLTAMQEELNQAVIDGFNVGTEGFETYLVYRLGNEQLRIACNLIAQAFQSLNPKYKCNVIAHEDICYLCGFVDVFPIDNVGWLADFADPHNFCEPYQATWGAFCYSQFEPAANAQPEDQAIVDQEINAALVETDPAKRQAMYQDLQYRYWLDVPSFPLVQPTGRRFTRDWVQGWYYNPLYPGLYAYDLWKSTAVLENIDVDITGAVTPATPTYNPVYIFHNQMRKGNGDPSPASMTYTLQVTRNDANNAVTTLYATTGLSRTFGSDKQYANCTYVAILAGGSANATVVWWEDGSNQIMLGSTSGIPYEVVGNVYPINSNANDTDLNNNQQAAGILVAKTLLGDVTGNGYVDIFDAIRLATAFGTSTGSRLYNADADLNSSGNIDIFDSILLATNFNRHVP